MLDGSCPQVVNINIAILEGFGNYYLHASHCCACRVGAVSRRWDQGNIPVRLAAALKVFADHKEACIFALGACVGLKAYARKACYLAQCVGELIEDLGITGSLIAWYKRVELTEARHGYRYH